MSYLQYFIRERLAVDPPLGLQNGLDDVARLAVSELGRNTSKIK